MAKNKDCKEKIKLAKLSKAEKENASEDENNGDDSPLLALLPALNSEQTVTKAKRAKPD